MKKIYLIIIVLSFFRVWEPNAAADEEAVSPAAVGWGNVLVPGLGATLRGQSFRGFAEATTEIGTYYGGTFFEREGAFTIDGTVLVPTGKNLVKPLFGQILQEFGLKLHMYNTFYNYQQASLAPGNAALQERYQQPLYKGTWDDVLLAPFKPKNFLKPLVFVPVLASAGYLFYEYRHTNYVRQNHSASAAEEAIYSFGQSISIPLGSSFGEEVFFRGFMQREMRYYTDSVWLSIAAQTVLFTAVHPPELRVPAFFGGIYYGLLANHEHGNLEPGIAGHFLIDFVNGLFVYLKFRHVEGKDVPLSARLSIPF